MNHGGDKPEDAEPFAWTRENSGKKVHPVKQKKPNAWGLHDVIGNRCIGFWRAGAGYGDASTKDHTVYGGTFHGGVRRQRARLANIMISDKAEGARFALIRTTSPLPKGHPENSPAMTNPYESPAAVPGPPEVPGEPHADLWPSADQWIVGKP